ncbi:bifunctional ornithine acetyltransferase/N-acetylglutamate synthase [Saccharothrix luteola]|uniref:bifunctional ornithine acetyltransferase/N-acetylglutamate synthase n=1 Tax=Saccharothrix luteola TaxID=2893018 RepID=UPI001E2869D6|nr:bifunctional ornithine acetyltransferase/N-acetylglutamate synthase [Saccharothrix luteola]MCC8246425.1 bifunctional ornithine acetyltransferase/N-acetylglutamate synthase [Saccharothrix luteola]
MAGAVFTRSRFTGPGVVMSRETARDHVARGVVALALNANVTTDAQGLANAVEVRRRSAGCRGGRALVRDSACASPPPHARS